MDYVLTCLLPGWLQWHKGHLLKAWIYALFATIFLGIATVGPLLLHEPQASYPLFWNLLAQAPSQANLLRLIGFGYFALTGFCSCVDACLYAPPAYQPTENDNELWKSALTLWLKGKTSEALKTTSQINAKQKKDPWIYYLQARLLLAEKKWTQARQSLARCEQLDYRHELSCETKQLKKILRSDG